MFLQVDVTGPLHSLHQGSAHLGAGRVAIRVDDSPHRMACLPPENQRAVGGDVEAGSRSRRCRTTERAFSARASTARGSLRPAPTARVSSAYKRGESWTESAAAIPPWAHHVEPRPTRSW